MSLIRWTPRRNGNDLTSLRTEVDRLFEDFFTPVPLKQDWASLTPPVDVEETPEAYVFRADLPGVSSKDVKVTVIGDTLTLRGERKREEKQDESSLHRIERMYGSFERSFTLGTPVRSDQVKAAYRDGVLEIRVPKADEARPREIEVQVG
ncbi:MAG TPA: Hsp20/alpha crystallin family protein [Candidatus Eisenbacteria bacterium]|jgi:HSP20 family protein